jgi:starvation-inducible outer membrane lipoprotein
MKKCAAPKKLQEVVMKTTKKSNKMFLTGMFSVTLAFGMMLAGCVSARTEVSAPPENNKILVVYFSQTENTRAVAEQIQQTIGGDLLEIKTVTPYEEETLMDTARNEQRADARPALATQIREPLETIK